MGIGRHERADGSERRRNTAAGQGERGPPAFAEGMERARPAPRAPNLGLALLILALAALWLCSPTIAAIRHGITPPAPPRNLLGRPGAYVSDLLWQWLGLGALLPRSCLPWGARLMARASRPDFAVAALGAPALDDFHRVTLAAALPATMAGRKQRRRHRRPRHVRRHDRSARQRRISTRRAGSWRSAPPCSPPPR